MNKTFNGKSFVASYSGGKRTICNNTAFLVFCSEDIFIATAKQNKIKITINPLEIGSDTISVGAFFYCDSRFLGFYHIKTNCNNN